MSSRTKARKRALDILFGADVRGVSIAAMLDEEAGRAAAQPQRESSWPYAREIVEGVEAHLADIDAEIEAHAQGWPLERMPALDRALARLATWEILYNVELPTAVGIDEAVELAKEFSTDDSGAFVHGVLARIARSS